MVERGMPGRGVGGTNGGQPRAVSTGWRSPWQFHRRDVAHRVHG
jgi:hypothetical protein